MQWPEFQCWHTQAITKHKSFKMLIKYMCIHNYGMAIMFSIEHVAEYAA
jgi:hypothetical protein